jgi:hypothetical protein
VQIGYALKEEKTEKPVSVIYTQKQAKMGKEHFFNR